MTEHNLDVLIGEGPAAITRGGTLVDAVRALEIPDSIPAAMIARRPDVRQADRNYAAAIARIGVADAARLPTIVISGSLGSQAGVPTDVFGNQTHVYQLLAGVSFPVFDNGRLANLSAAARARADQAKASYEGTTLNALREANDALAGVRTARDQAVAQATQVTALRQALDLAESRYQAGLSTLSGFARRAAKPVQRGAGAQPGAVGRADRGRSVVQGARRVLANTIAEL